MVQRLYAGDGMRGRHSLCRSNLNSPKTWGAQRPCAHQKCSQNKNDICRFTVLQTKINRHLRSILGQIINFIHCHILTSSLIYLHGDKFVKNNNNNGQLHFGRGKAGPGFLVDPKEIHISISLIKLIPGTSLHQHASHPYHPPLTTYIIFTNRHVIPLTSNILM